jgi:hypothetical protein
MRRFIAFHILVPGDWTVQRGHDLLERIEEAGFEPDHRVPATNAAGDVVKKPKKPKKRKDAPVVLEDVRFRPR